MAVRYSAHVSIHRDKLESFTVCHPLHLTSTQRTAKYSIDSSETCPLRVDTMTFSHFLYIHSVLTLFLPFGCKTYRSSQHIPFLSFRNLRSARLLSAFTRCFERVDSHRRVYLIASFFFLKCNMQKDRIG